MIGRRSVPWVVLVLAVVAWAASGIYSVGSDEEGLVLRFGRLVRAEGAGLHYHLPYPIEAVRTVHTRMVRSISIGDKGTPQTARLTGDENLLNLRIIVQYSVKDPRQYALQVDAPEAILQNALDSVLAGIIATRTVDDVLTTGKTEIQSEARARTQELLDRVGIGLQLVNVSVQETGPPDPVVEAFNDVASAREDADKYIHEAEAYANTVRPAASGEAQQALQQAQAERDARIRRARGEAARFVAVWNAYRKSPSLTARRLLMETMEIVLPGMKKFMATKGTATVIFEDLPY